MIQALCFFLNDVGVSFLTKNKAVPLTAYTGLV